MILGFSRFKIAGHSMQPAYNGGDHVLVFRFAKIKNGDVVAFKHSSKVLIKRVISKKHEKYYLEGDNKNDSFDSRSFGGIEKHDIIGKVIYKL